MQESGGSGEVPQTQVKVNCMASVEFGEKMKIVGDCEALGNWDIENAIDLEWGAGDIWTATVALNPGVHELKVPLGFTAFLLTNR